MTRSRAAVPDSADVVMSAAASSARASRSTSPRRARKVVLLERDQLGSGSTSKAAGGVRAQFSDPLNIEIARRSLEAFEAFEERPGWDIGLHEVGYLFLFTREEDVERFRRDIELQNALGVPSR